MRLALANRVGFGKVPTAALALRCCIRNDCTKAKSPFEGLFIRLLGGKDCAYAEYVLSLNCLWGRQHDIRRSDARFAHVGVELCRLHLPSSIWRWNS